jgi:hypothetical protein
MLRPKYPHPAFTSPVSGYDSPVANLKEDCLFARDDRYQESTIVFPSGATTRSGKLLDPFGYLADPANGYFPCQLIEGRAFAEKLIDQPDHCVAGKPRSLVRVRRTTRTIRHGRNQVGLICDLNDPVI